MLLGRGTEECMTERQIRWKGTKLIDSQSLVVTYLTHEGGGGKEGETIGWNFCRAR